MPELIKIEERDGQQLVSARELYGFLGASAQFTDWCKRMFDYGFVDGVDFVEVYHKNVNNPNGGRPSTDYALTLDCAKEIAMIQRTEKGKQARQYFIECEKKLRQSTAQLKPQSRNDFMQMQMQLMQMFLDEQIEIKQEVQLLKETMSTVSAKVTAVNDEFFTLAGYYQVRDQRFNLTIPQTQQTGKTLKRKSEELGYIIGSTHSERYGRVNTYHRHILQAVLGF